MTLLDLCNDLNLDLKRTAGTNGGEYHCACPSCGGCDRFVVWPSEGTSGRYWCRQCDKSGDAIQFCRDFMGLSFREACEKLSFDPLDRWTQTQPRRELPKASKQPEALWKEKATAFADICHTLLMNEPVLFHQLRHSRGLTEQTIRMCRLGWNTTNLWPTKSEWGIADDEKMCLPKGWVIPFSSAGTVHRIRIRRADWCESDKFPKYWETSGGSDIPLVCGFLNNQIVVVVEAEFDALLIRQEVGEFCTCLAVCGTGMQPDAETDRWLRSRKLILLAFDWDGAGKTASRKWRETYPNSKHWPPASGKSVADAFLKEGFSVGEWYEEGVSKYCYSHIR